MGFRDLDVYASEAVNIARAGEPVFLPIRPLTELLFYLQSGEGKRKGEWFFPVLSALFFVFIFYFNDFRLIIDSTCACACNEWPRDEKRVSPFFLSFFLSFIRIHIGYSRTVNESTPGIERKSFAIDRRMDMLLYQELTFRFLVWGWRFLPH